MITARVGASRDRTGPGGDRLHDLRFARPVRCRVLDEFADPALRGSGDRLGFAVLVEHDDTGPMVGMSGSYRRGLHNNGVPKADR